MASLRKRRCKDGTETFAVVYRFNGKQTSTSFTDFKSASRFCDLATKFGPKNALESLRADISPKSGMTVGSGSTGTSITSPASTTTPSRSTGPTSATTSPSTSVQFRCQP